MNKNKKRKLIAGICAPVGALAVAGTSIGVVLALTRKNNNTPITPVEEGDFTVTFNPGIGHITSGKTSTKVKAGVSLDCINQPSVSSEGALFSGWKDENGDPVIGKQIITKDTVLTADYSNDALSENAVITFTKGEADAIHGNASVSVKKGYKFFMVNRPSAVKANYVFKGWAKSGESTIISENEKITGNLTLKPLFDVQRTITFDLNGGTLVRGSLTQKVPDQTEFGNINQPYFTKGEEYFKGWYDAKTGGNPIDATTKITSDRIVYAQWEQYPSEIFCQVHAVQNTSDEQPSVDFIGNTAQYVYKSTSSWNLINKPQAVATSTYKPLNWKLSKWQWCPTNSTTQTDWHDVDEAGHVVEFNHDNIYIRPVMIETISAIYIEGKDEVLPNTEETYTSYIVGGAEGSIEWSLDGLDKSIKTVSIDSATGKLTIGDIAAGVDTSKLSFKVKASWKNNKTQEVSKTATLDTQIILPTVKSNKVWRHLESPTTGQSNWQYAELTQVCDPSSTIQFYNVNGTAAGSPVARADYNDPTYLGDAISPIPAYFLYGCSKFNQPLTINSKYIGASFLEGCSSFNSNITFGTNVKWIDNDFMYGCEKFGYSSTTPTVVAGKLIDLDKTGLIWIGDNFMGECIEFTGAGEQIKLPSTIKEIGNNFLYDCVKFDSALTLPSSITKDSTYNGIGDFFMTDCDAFKSQLTISCSADVFANGDHSLSSSNSSATMFTTGLDLAGTGAAGVKTKFAPKNDSSNFIYRSYKNEVYEIIINASDVMEQGSKQTPTATINARGTSTGTATWSFDPASTGSTFNTSTHEITAGNAAGYCYLTIAQDHVTTTKAIYVKGSVFVASIEINQQPTTTTYASGANFDLAGLKIKAKMSDGTEKILEWSSTETHGITTDPEHNAVLTNEGATAKTITVVVTYSLKTATFNITVNPAA